MVSVVFALLTALCNGMASVLQRRAIAFGCIELSRSLGILGQSETALPTTPTLQAAD